MICPHCLHEIETAFPVEPIYTLKTVAQLVPFSSVNALHDWLKDHKAELGPAQYRRSGIREYRMLTATEVRYIRSKLVRPVPFFGLSRKARALLAEPTK